MEASSAFERLLNDGLSAGALRSAREKGRENVPSVQAQDFVTVRSSLLGPAIIPADAVAAATAVLHGPNGPGAAPEIAYVAGAAARACADSFQSAAACVCEALELRHASGAAAARSPELDRLHLSLTGAAWALTSGASSETPVVVERVVTATLSLWLPPPTAGDAAIAACVPTPAESGALHTASHWVARQTSTRGPGPARVLESMAAPPVVAALASGSPSLRAAAAAWAGGWVASGAAPSAVTRAFRESIHAILGWPLGGTDAVTMSSRAVAVAAAAVDSDGHGPPDTDAPSSLFLAALFDPLAALLDAPSPGEGDPRVVTLTACGASLARAGATRAAQAGPQARAEASSRACALARAAHAHAVVTGGGPPPPIPDLIYLSVTSVLSLVADAAGASSPAEAAALAPAALGALGDMDYAKRPYPPAQRLLVSSVAAASRDPTASTAVAHAVAAASSPGAAPNSPTASRLSFLLTLAPLVLSQLGEPAVESVLAPTALAHLGASSPAVASRAHALLGHLWLQDPTRGGGATSAAALPSIPRGATALPADDADDAESVTLGPAGRRARLLPAYLAAALPAYPRHAPLDALVAALGAALRSLPRGHPLAALVMRRLGDRAVDLESFAASPPAAGGESVMECVRGAGALRLLLSSLIPTCSLALLPAALDASRTALEAAPRERRAAAAGPLFAAARASDAVRKPVVLKWLQTDVAPLID